MTLVKKVEKILDELSHEEAAKKKALQDAERLADKFKDVTPSPFVVPMERFFGLPAHSIK